MHKKQFALRPLRNVLALIGLLNSSTLFASSNFNIVPLVGAPFPNSMSPGSYTNAWYKITNNTTTPKNGYAITPFSGPVRQNSQNPNYCQNIINLAPNGLPNDSCILELDITGPVKSTFGICKGSNCTYLTKPLNVALNSAPPPMIAAGNYVNNAIPTNLYAPLLAQSQNDGKTWIYPSSVQTELPTNFDGDSTLYDASCSGNSCVIAGYY